MNICNSHSVNPGTKSLLKNHSKRLIFQTRKYSEFSTPSGVKSRVKWRRPENPVHIFWILQKSTYLAKLRWFWEPEGPERSWDPPGSPFRWNLWGTRRISQGNLANSTATVSMCSCSEWILSLPREWPFPRSKCQGRWTYSEKSYRILNAQ